jgi:Tryptophan-rich Synechocystis species C-terminal domain/Putative esterase
MSTTPIETFGSTSLLESENDYLLQPNGGAAVELSYGGAPVVVGQFDQFGAWAPIGAEQTASGYEVAWKVTGADQYMVWTTDTSGNYLSIAVEPVSGASTALQSFETSFHQDLNGDGVIGPPAPPTQTVIEAFGSTNLVEVGSNYFLQPNGGSAVELSYGGAPVVDGQFAQFGAWAPIGAEQTASGYEVAWKVTGADQYMVWTTDSSGKYLSIAVEPVSGASTALQSFETSFHQDLNGDGVIGPPAPPTQTVIEAFGSTNLVERENNYFLQPNGGAAVELSYGGAPVVVGQFDQFGAWAPIGAEQTASGYEVAWKVTGADQYMVWTTDTSGNYLSIAVEPVSGASTALQSFETSFHQDLNGDGVIGPPAPPTQTVIEAFGSTSLVEVGSNYFLQPNGGSAVELSYGGAPVVDGQFAQLGFVPIGAEQTATGYEVAWKVTGADQYTVWTTDTSGNYLSSAFDVASGTSAALQSLETSFHQDLNGDGVIGPPAPPTQTVIEAFGSTSLVEVGSNYFLQPNGGSAVELSYGGAPVVDGQFAQLGFVPIGAEQTATGYEVAWKVTGADQYTVWTTDTSGNYLSSAFDVASGASAALQSFETSFHQDLNGDGVIGPSGVTSPPGSAETPQFIYQGLDASGAQLYSVTWQILGSHPFEVRVLAPTNPSVDYEHSFLFTLPVEAGLAQSTFGDGLNELQKLDVQDQYNTTIIEPIFPIDPWYADNPNDATINYETFTAKILPAWVDSNFATTGTEENLLLGFSKSGYGALDLILKHPDVFDAVAAFDFPADAAAYNGSPYGSYGTDANFQDNYRLSDTFIDAWKAPFLAQDRILISEGSVFATQVADFDTLLTSQGVEHTLLTQTSDSHNWDGGWLSDAVAGLYGLETDLHQTVIEALGSTSLVEHGNNYLLVPNGGSPVELSYGESAVVAGQLDQSGGPWAAIGAEQTASGYEVAWKLTGADQYMAWNTDSSGKYLSNAFDVASGASTTVQSLETSFHQDLNGDGYIGLVLNGSSGGQTLTAGDSPPTLIGGPNDILNGGAGADTFVFLPNFGANTVNNFTPGTDVLQFSRSTFPDAAAVLGNAHQVGSDVAITDGSLDVVTLHSVQLTNLHASDFHII